MSDDQEVSRETPQCSKCGGENRRTGQRWCHACHAAYMRTHRPKAMPDDATTPKERELLKHALGIGTGRTMSPASIAEHREDEHRNYYAADVDDEDWPELARRGLAVLFKKAGADYPLNYYRVTDAGKAALR